MLKNRVIPCLDVKNGRVVKGINFEDLPEINDKLNGGDISNEILEDVLETLDVSVEDYKNEEELWKDLYLLNYEDVARDILDNDVFDKDYIRS